MRYVAGWRCQARCGGVELAAAEDGRREVAVDALGRAQRVVSDRAESLQPGGGALVVAAERIGGQIVQALVVLGEAEAAREHWRLRELLLEEGVGEVGER